MVLYRKYRFQSFDEMVGQVGVKQTLLAAISSGKLAHAYLFCGPRGTGKTSAARVVAKIVNCEQSSVVSRQSSDKQSLRSDDLKTSGSLKTDSEAILNTDSLPCNKCSTCLSITDGSNLDVIEMDAASNRGIEDIRALRETIKLSPTSAKKKVYIIDEVHMLSTDAFNALLKTLEEPPEHVMFILATTEVQKLPQTILSRVQRLNFQMASTEEMCESLKRVAKAEKIEITDEALLSLAKLAGGSFRDGIKFLDQLSSFGKINQETVEKGLGTGVYEGIYLLLKSVAEKDAPEALKKLFGQIDQGVAVKELAILILGQLQHLLLIKNNLGDQLVKPEIGEEKYSSLKTLAAEFTADKIVAIAHSFQKSLEQIRYVSLPALPVELAIIESCGIKEKPSVISRQTSDKQSLRSDDLKTEDSLKTDSSPRVEAGEAILKTESLPEIPIIAIPSADASEDMQKISEKWTYILETVKSVNYSLEALLRSAKIAKCEGKSVVLEVPYSFHQRIIEAPKSRDLIESIFSDILQRNIAISTVLSPKASKREELSNIEVAQDDEIVRLAAEIFNSETVN